MTKWIKGLRCPGCGCVTRKKYPEICQACGHRPSFEQRHEGSYYRFIPCSIRRRWPWQKWEVRDWGKGASDE